MSPSSTEDGSTLCRDESEILAAQIAVPSSSAGFTAIYRYQTRRDTVVLVLSTIAAIAAGAVLPLMTIAVGSLAGQFSDSLNAGHESATGFAHSTQRLTLYLLYLGIASLVTVTVSSFGFMITGESITTRLRSAYLSALLRQNIAFFDTIGAGEVATRIANDMNLIQDGISQKVSLLITGLSGFVSALVIALVRDWRLGLVMLSLPVVVILTMGGLGSRMKVFQEASNNAYAEAGSFAEEVISSMRSVSAYGSGDRFLRKYEQSLKPAMALDFKAKMAMGFMMALMFMNMFWGYGLTFWQGNRFLQQGNSSISQIITVMLASSMAGVLLGHSAPFVAGIVQAGAAANRIFATIERPSPINPFSTDGTKLNGFKGSIRFENIKFVYPSRTDHVILDDFSLHVQAGRMTAIVGPSGSGKTTLFSLIERLYDPVGGRVLFDDVPLKDIDLRWLRGQIGLVAQDNFLFNTSIYENILYGLGLDAMQQLDDEKKMTLVVDAAKIANAHEFISALPNGYHTNVGERGSSLSGGQRQRVAIARAVVSNPPILLLDEATAALDTKSEAAVQAALHAAAQGRTTVVIAHRLSTIRKADSIIVLQDGKVVDQGTHDELLAKESTYAMLVKAQQLQTDAAPSREEESESSDMDMKLEAATRTHSAGPGPQQGQQNPVSSIGRLIKVLWSINAPERRYLVLGIACSFLAGPGYPMQALFLGNAIISMVNSELSTGHNNVNFWALMFFILGIVLFVVFLIQGVCFAIAGSRLTSRARLHAFASILRQEMAFFDSSENSSASLTAFLSVDANKLTGISGTTMGAILNSAMTLVSAIAVACPFGWKLALVATSTVPILLGCGFLRFWIVTQIERHVKRDTHAAALAGEAVSAIRTVAALAAEDIIQHKYEEKLKMDGNHSVSWSFFSSLAYAFTQSFALFITALIYWYGGMRLIGSGEYNVQQFFICFMAVVWGAQAAGTIFSYAPDIAGAKEAATRLDFLTSREPEIDALDADGERVEKLIGNVAVQGVDFSFPSQPHVKILQNVNFSAEPGRFIGLVGASGSGKSTVLNLIERFYEVTAGSIAIDHKDIRRYQLESLRRRIGLVEQDATLVGSSIKECLLGDTDDVADDEILQACREANIYDFVISLPDGLSTDPGTRGSRVSGGQRQRLAIAKALLRKPSILLLDEATSALDAESEQVVQKAINNATHGRTTIAVAHRLSSIAHADCIYLFDRGKLVESGTHDELIQARGKYWELVKMQDLSK